MSDSGPFKRLGIWAKLGVVGSIASIVGLLLAWRAPAPQSSSATTSQNGIVGGDQVGRDKIEINPRLRIVEKRVLDNEGSPTLVLKNPGDGKQPLTVAMMKNNQLGVAPVGTEVRVLGEERTTAVPFLTLTKVELLSSDLKGVTGWVSRNTIRIVREPE